MNRFRSSRKLLFVLSFSLFLAAVMTGSAAAETDVYQGIPFHPFTMDAGNGTCIPFYDADLQTTTSNCDPVNLVFPGRTWEEVRDLLLADGWSTCCAGTRQSLHYDTAELHLDDEQLVKPGSYFDPRYHIRLWQAPGEPIVTFAAVHHEYFDWGSFNHVIDMDWEQAETDVAQSLCGQACDQTGFLTTQSAIQGDDGTWRPAGIDNLLNDASATVIPGPTTPNNPPSAADDAYSTAQNGQLWQDAPGVLGNDSDPDGDLLTAVLVAGPSHGNLILNQDGSFQYTPADSFVGTDSFTYMAHDGTADSNIATVTITVTQVNYLPVAMNDSYSTDEDLPLTITAPGVLENDTDANGDQLTAVRVDGPNHGALTLNQDGSFQYAPAGGFSGNDSFTYVANDGTANSNIATVAITVNPVSGPPPDVDQVATGEVAVAGTVSGSFVDTHAQDAAIQAITERESGGKKTDRHSYLEHKWSFDVQSGNSVTFFVDAWQIDSPDGDNFILAYSTDDVTYLDMVVVTKTSDDDAYQEYTLPPTTSGTVFVRARDTDQTAGNHFLDTFIIDHMFIRTEAPSSDPPTPSDTTHVDALNSSARVTGPGGKWQATVTITVHDNSNAPVPGAIVVGLWSDGTSGSCQTLAASNDPSNGQCSITKGKINGNVLSLTFTVTDITHASMVYDPGSNPIGDSIVISRP